jgi:ribonuclease BN (tRNA processing enzyme)
MKVTIVGSGDAFGTGGRAHTCIRIDSGAMAAVVDFGAGSIISWQKLSLNFNDVDLIVISHLHGDHFGGLPFFLLACQFVSGRTKPLLMIGPPGFKRRLESLLETFFPGAMTFKWGFPWQADEILARRVSKLAGMTVETFEVLHPSGGLATGVRLSDGERTFAFSGDTGWTDSLVELSAAADLFLVECYSGDAPVPNHMDWPTLKLHVRDFTAKQTVVTHLGETALPRIPEMEAEGLVIAYDGRTFEL